MLKVKSGFVLRTIGTQTVAVPIGQRTSDIHGVVALSDSGALLWKELEKGAEKEALINILLDTYEIDRETVVSDLEDFIKGLHEQGALEE
ncbi:MAG: PqqD family protein [Clostridia bacterium]|nr:PqqD family protein [Clostridia bacterium]